MATAHIQAEKGQVAKTVLMPGDPLRAKYIVEKYLENPVQFNSVRNMFGYTGMYKGNPISVMGSGMGMPSIGIYSYELYSQYGVENIIRIGSAGAYSGDVNVGDIVLVSEAYSESSFAKVQSGYDKDITYPTESLNTVIRTTATELGTKIFEGRIHSSDVFYQQQGTDFKAMASEKECLAVEMESFALFHNAKVLGKNSACLLTISDSFVTEEAMSAEARETSFNGMMELALDSAIKL